MLKGRSVRLYLAEGTSTGILTAEIVNWTGHVLSGPRTRLEVALRRDEVNRTGVYLLFGREYDADLPSVYVGEGDNISTRLYSHSKDEQKEFWERFVAVTSKDMNLTKAHVKYLEGRLISMLKDAKKCIVKNKTEPSFDKLPEADISDMETFLDELKLVLPVVDFDFLRKPNISPPEIQASEPAAQQFILAHVKKGIKATAVEVSGEFVVLSGAIGSRNEAVSFGEGRRAFRQQIVESGRARYVDSEIFMLTEDIAFSSPSAAAVFLFGTSRNGRTDWMLEGKSKTYGDWKDEILAKEARS